MVVGSETGGGEEREVMVWSREGCGGDGWWRVVWWWWEAGVDELRVVDYLDGGESEEKS